MSALLVYISLLINDISWKKKREEKNQKVRCEWDPKSHAGHAGHLSSKTEKNIFKKKILSNAYETIVVNGNLNNARPHEQGLSRSKTFTNSSLYNLVIVFLKVLMLRKGGLIDLLSARFLWSLKDKVEVYCFD